MPSQFDDDLTKEMIKAAEQSAKKKPFTWDDLEWWDTGEWQKIEERLDDCEELGAIYNPVRSALFLAMDETPFEQVKVVIVGQDPYPDFRHATGLAFSVPRKIRKLPPTLKNIFEELKSDLQIEAKHGDLTSWAKQGVFLWNTIPTVLHGRPGSCSKWYEYEELNKEVFTKLSEERDHLVFILWGNKAQEWRKLIDETKHKIIASPHPSPLSFRRGFEGSRPFSTCNIFLKEFGYDLIDWEPR